AASSPLVRFGLAPAPLLAFAPAPFLPFALPSSRAMFASALAIASLRSFSVESFACFLQPIFFAPLALVFLLVFFAVLLAVFFLVAIVVLLVKCGSGGPKRKRPATWRAFSNQRRALSRVARRGSLSWWRWGGLRSGG